MSDTRRGLPLVSSRIEQIFPTLTPAQIRRIVPHGHTRAMRHGQVLIEQGDRNVPFFVVVSGRSKLCDPLAVLKPLSRSMAQVSSQVRSTCSLAGRLSF